ncbi:heparanase [Anabrus simplex]|uniref:heparanase n=1 Tax=Anabrus simplex TaxID=316456 RepID=UPI0035A38448
MTVLLLTTKDKPYYNHGRKIYRRGRTWCIAGCALAACITVLTWFWSWYVPEMCVVNILQPVRNVSREFLSVALDTGLIQDGRIHYLRCSKLQQIAAVLGPAYLRVGGTAADCLLFDTGDEQPKSQNTSIELLDGGACSYEGLDCKKRPAEFRMSGQEWMEINQFAQNAGLTLIFDLNVLLRDGQRWNTTNAKELLEFSAKYGFVVVWQLGNEPNSFQHVFQTTVSGYQLGEDFVMLRNLLESFPQYRSSKLVGPDVTRPRDLEQGSIAYLRDFLSSIDDQTLNAITWHQYYLNGRTATVADFISPQTLNVLEQQIKAVEEVVADFFPEVPIWLSETSSAYGGGAPDLSDRFLAGFLWLDKLGVAARLGIDVVIRQSLLGGHYALLDDHSFEPRPDWWLSVLFKAFVGHIVLSVGSQLPHGSVRLYCHCTPSNSLNSNLTSITIYGLNLRSKTVRVELPQVPDFRSPSGYKSGYVLTGEYGLTSKSVLLNGKKLMLNPDGSLPPFVPVHSDMSSPLIFPPYSMGFWVLHNLVVPACLP